MIELAPSILSADPQENARQLLESAREAANQAGQDLSSVLADGSTDDHRCDSYPSPDWA
jgi:hypothetical protein